MSTTARISLLDGETLTGVTVTVTVEPEAPVRDLVEALAPFLPASGELYLDDTPLTYRERVGDLGLLDGMIIAVGRPVEPLHDRDAGTGVDVLIAGGPDAGRTLNLPPGRHDIGRDLHRAVAVSDPEVSRQHALLDVGGDSVVLTDQSSSNETIVDGAVLAGPRSLTGGEYIRMGRTVLTVAAPEVADTALIRGLDGTIIYNRRFRSAVEQPAAAIDFPEPYEEEPPPVSSIVYLLVPMVLGIVMALVMKSRTFLMFAFLGPVTGVAGMWASRRQHRVRQARQRAKHDQKVADAQSALHRALTLEVRARRAAAPDPAELVRAARGPRRRLWERRANDDDFLTLRVGLADQPTRVAVSGGLAPERPVLPDLPVSVPLIEAGHLGVARGAAGPGQASGIARTLLFQLAALHSPGDVRIVVVSPDPSWSWTQWLPHVRADAGDDRLLLGTDPSSSRARLDELDALIAARKKATGPYGGAASVLPRFVVLFDHPSRLDRVRVGRILAEGPSVGVHAICIEDTEPELPEEYAGATIAPSGDRLVVRVRNRMPVEDVREEVVHLRYVDLAARCLAPLRPESTSAADLPTSARYLDVLGLDRPDPATVAAGWSGRSGRCAAVVGVGPGGPIEIELDDRAPHGLVAGTSGAGKSEFLKTFLAGLALTNHPDDLQFLLIDFKGGGDYRTLATLPHTIDLVTNTDDPDQAGVKRALGLLEAEVERRQRLVNEHGARDLATYRTTRARQPDLPVMGRLLVVADEFGELASRQPELLDKLVSVARVGRALGVHLLLATQRPSGSITPQIQANVPLRVCFRVLEGEAADVIGSSEPESIPRRAAGRGFVRNGDEAPVELQCGRVANARPAIAAAVEPVRIDVSSWQTAGHVRESMERGVEVPDPDTDLWDITQAVIDAAAGLGWTENPVPWPRPLPESIRFSPRRVPMTDETGRTGANVGMRDDPRSQRHVPHAVVIGGGNVAVVGAPRTGRTTAVRTIVAGLGYAAPPHRLHIHAIDLAGGGLRSLRPLPHLGTITDDPAIAARLLDRLEEEVAERRDDFAAQGWSNLAEQWADRPGAALPAIVLVVDGWEAVADLPSSARSRSMADRIVKLLSEGSSVGVQAVVAGDRSAAGQQIGRQMNHRLVLGFNDPSDYAFADIDARAVPRPHPPGRALVPLGRGGADQVQISHVGRDASGPTQTAALRAIGEHLSSMPAPRSMLPFRLSALPGRIALDEVLAAGGGVGRFPVPVGVGGDEAAPVWVDLDAAPPGILVAGGPGTGRTNALAAIGRAALAADRPVVVATTRPSDLASLPGVRAAVSWADLTVGSVRDLLAEPALVLVDDADEIERNDEVMEAILDAQASGVRVVAAGATDVWRDVISGWVSRMRRSRTAILLAPSSNYDGNAIGLSEALSPEQQFSRPAGRALLSHGGRLQLIQVPKS